MGALDRAGREALERLPEGADELVAARLCALLLREIATGYFSQVHHDPTRPEMPALFHAAFRSQFPCADDSISVTPIDPRGVYRLSGDPGTVCCLDLQVRSGELVPYGRGSPGRVLAEHDLRALPVAADGRFEVMLSARRPEADQGAWWPLGPDASCLILRQRYLDWEAERGASVALERLDPAEPAAGTEAERIFERMAAVSTWVQTQGRLAVEHPLIASWRAAGVINTVKTYAASEPGLLPNQYYTNGIFELGEGEVLFIYAEIPDDMSYWSITLGDELGCTLDYTHHLSSTNRCSAEMEAGGRLRAIVAPEDPGVANWLDTAGRCSGFLVGRWRGSPRPPQITARTIDQGEVDELFFSGGSSRWTPRRREGDLERRRRAAQMRRKW